MKAMELSRVMKTEVNINFYKLPNCHIRIYKCSAVIQIVSILFITILQFPPLYNNNNITTTLKKNHDKISNMNK